MPSTTDGRLRVGVIGTGFGSNVHVPAFKASDDFRAMLREVADLDAVSIATPGGLHHEMVLACAEAGKHILCEKPFATSLDQAREMLAAVQGAGVGHAVNHEFRMIPARAEFKRMVAEG